MAAYLKSSYEDFEPFCQWQRGQERDILEVHLQGFKREHLRVHINNYGILTISGEQPVQDAKISRFRKEIKVSKDCTADKIRAKFASGILYITLPKVSATQPSAHHDSEKSSRNETGNINNGAPLLGEKSIRQTTSRLRDGMLSIQISTTVAVSIALVLAVGITVGIALVYLNSGSYHILMK